MAKNTDAISVLAKRYAAHANAGGGRYGLALYDAAALQLPRVLAVIEELQGIVRAHEARIAELEKRH